MHPDAVEPEGEPSVLEYARFYGLCRDYTLSRARVEDVEPPSDEVVEREGRNPEGYVFKDARKEIEGERLEINREAAVLLKGVMSCPGFEIEDFFGEEWRRVRALRVEGPLLRYDEEVEGCEFGGGWEVPRLEEVEISFEMVDEEKCEGMEFSGKSLEPSADFKDSVDKEKLVVTREGLKLLQEVVKSANVGGEWGKWSVEIDEYKRNPALEPLTPPLLPISPPPTPYIPSSPGNRLELLSEGANSTAEEAKAIHEKIMADDTLERNPSDDSDDMLFDIMERPHSSPVILSPIMKRRFEDLKVEGPLTPPMFSDTPMKKLKLVSFQDMIQEYVPELPSLFESGNDVLSSCDDFTEFYKDVLPLAENAKKSVENEKLIAADTALRIDVPEVDSSLPEPPWNEFSRKIRKYHPSETELDAQSKLLVYVKRNFLQSSTSWHGASALESTLPWAMFDVEKAKANVRKKLDEELHGDIEMRRLVAEPTSGDIVLGSTELWKRDSLQILDQDNDESEDELELQDLQFPGSQGENDLTMTLRKMRLDLEEVEEDMENEYGWLPSKHQQFEKAYSFPWNGATRNFHRDAETKKAAKISGIILNSHENLNWKANNSKSGEKLPTTDVKTDNSVMFGGDFSASLAIKNFMRIHGKVSPDKEPSKKPEVVGPSETHKGPKASGYSKPLETRTVARDQPHESATLPSCPDLPSVPEDLPCSPFVVSYTLLQRRDLIKEIQKLYPAANIVDRDFGVPHSPSNEADVILSPSTGLLITTLQQLKQRALPGQPDRSPAKERIALLDRRYERLVVIVSEGLSREMESQGISRPVDPRNEQTIAQLENFASQLEGEAIVKYIHGGDLALARVIVCDMATYGLSYESKDMQGINILTEETYWELFLRRAGLNPFAAQVIISSLKNAYNPEVETSSLIYNDTPPRTVPIAGLSAFLMMTAEERIDRFQVLLGGNRVLRRVNALLERKWISAANGFGGMA